LLPCISIDCCPTSYLVNRAQIYLTTVFQVKDTFEEYIYIYIYKSSSLECVCSTKGNIPQQFN
jgi:hypothetical protein